MNFTKTNHSRWVARATSPCRRATGRAEWRRIHFDLAALLSSVRLSRSGRQVADRHRLVACATPLEGKVASRSSQYGSHFRFTQQRGQL